MVSTYIINYLIYHVHSYICLQVCILAFAVVIIATLVTSNAASCALFDFKRRF